MKNQNLIYIILIVVIVIAAGFGAYEVFFKKASAANQTSDSQNQNQTFSGGNGGGNRLGGRGNFTPPISGTISSISGSAIVMKASDDSTKTVNVDSSTRIIDFENGQRSTLTLSNLTVGETINVMAENSSSSSFTARMIFIGIFTPGNRGNWNGGSSGNQSSGSGNSTSSGSI